MKRLFSSIICATMVLSSTPSIFVKTVNAETLKIRYQQPIEVKLITGVGNTDQINFTLMGAYYFTNKGEVLESGTYAIRNVGSKLSLYKGSTLVYTGSSQENLSLFPASYNKEHTLKIGSYSYLGSFDFKVEGSNVRPYNTLELEDYLKGVVPYEIGPNSPLEALKAQAVAARTYVLKNNGSMKVENTTKNQVYLGYNSSYVSSNKAVNDTSGVALKFGSSYAGTYYSSSNGGKVMSNTNSWGTTRLPYLVMKEDPYDLRSAESGNPHVSWQFSFDKQQIDLTNVDVANPHLWWETIREKVEDQVTINAIKTWMTEKNLVDSKYEIKITNIVSIEFDSNYTQDEVNRGRVVVEYILRDKTKPNDSIDAYVLDTDHNIAIHSTLITDRSDNLRALFGIVNGKQLLKSPHVKSVVDDGDTITISGGGWGHGIGMSQYGAMQMAKENKTFDEILNFYYPGTTLTPFTAVAPPVVPNIPVNPEVSTESFRNFTVNYNYPTLTVEFDITKSGNIDVTLEKPNGTLVKTIKSRTWESAGHKKYTMTDNHLTGEYIVKVRYANADREVFNEDLNVSFVKPTPVDTTAPVISAFTTSVGDDNQVTIKFSVNEPSSVKVTANNSTIKQANNVNGSYSFVWDASQFNSGTQSIKITATDSANNTSSRTANVTLTDVILPKITSHNVTLDGQKAIIKYRQNKPAKITVSIHKNNQLVKTVYNNHLNTGLHQTSWTATESGTYTYKIKIVDSLNKSHEVSGTFSVTVPKVTTKQHTVVRGDTLWAISRKHNVSVANIKSWNKLKTDTLYVGQKLIVSKTSSTPTTPTPTPDTKAKIHTVVRGDTLWAISRKYNVSVANIKSWNKLKTDTLYVGQKLIVSKTSSTTTPAPTPTPKPDTKVVYTVKKGDTLWGISTKYNVSISQIMKLNKLNNSIVYIGQKLTIK